MTRTKKIVQAIAGLVMFVCFMLTLGFVGGNEIGELSNKDMMIRTSISNGVMIAAGFIVHKIEESEYLTKEEYEELLRKEEEK